ncbi:Dcp1-like decapping enzyme [Klebsormidium nitens]|uniref:Dcp1-like decapping enzyme n=1 Tax=Klebsormidium nitens TaxID=105231 RepID=A0A1Y1I395_KLENI|nr:Dcp1-like decapping enzyme [Klebsormidium nitens]|eukprot:GAQ82588.1 Dcp1-like decapping enzyme [Klebsormidium nitens]
MFRCLSEGLQRAAFPERRPEPLASKSPGASMAQSRTPQPQIDQESAKELNLAVLQRMDANVEDILATAGHVTLYEFDVDEKQWSRKDVEGSLFVVKRRTQPRFQFIVMNRRSTENLVEDLLGDFEFEVQTPYLLYRNAVQEVNGIWFYNPRECEDAAKLITRIISAFNKTPPKPKAFAPVIPAYQELEPTGETAAAVVAEPLEGPSDEAISSPEEPAADLLQRFFNTAIQLSQGESSTGPSAPPAPPLPGPNSFLPPPSNQAPLPGLFHPTKPQLAKPAFFVPPPLPSSGQNYPPSYSQEVESFPPAAARQKPGHLPHGSPLLQPFPPPAPPPTLTPLGGGAHVPEGVSITRDRIREALAQLVQDDRFVDLVYEAVKNAHAD